MPVLTEDQARGGKRVPRRWRLLAAAALAAMLAVVVTPMVRPLESQFGGTLVFCGSDSVNSPQPPGFHFERMAPAGDPFPAPAPDSARMPTRRCASRTFNSAGGCSTSSGSRGAG